jgi:hypothetical protein
VCLACIKLTLIVCDQDEKNGKCNLPAAELCQSSKQSIDLRVSDDLRVLRVYQGRGEAEVRCRSHGAEVRAPSLGVLSAVRYSLSNGSEGLCDWGRTRRCLWARQT